MRLIYTLAALAALPMLLGASCNTNTPGTTPNLDPVVDAGADELRALGQDYQAIDEFGWCVAGVSLEGVADGTQAWGIPLKQSIEAGATSGTLAGFTIDPSICIGRPGTPETPEQVQAQKELIEDVLDRAVPPIRMTLRTGAAVAILFEDPAACVRMTKAADLIGPSGDFLVEILTVVESPGDPFHVPETAWSGGVCGMAVDVMNPVPVNP